MQLKKLGFTALLAFTGLAFLAPSIASAAPSRHHKHKVCKWDRHHHQQVCRWVRR